MHNLSMVQALSIWSDLEAAYYGKNGYGGDTAEIYAYRLMPYRPTFEMEGESFKETKEKVLRDAARSLRALVEHFEDTHDCRIHVVFGRADYQFARAFLKEHTFDHRIHLRVEPT